MSSASLFDAPTLALAMIVRNEESNLRAWLPLAACYTDEIVIVDTGSTDGTVPFLKSMNVRLLEQPWANDFAKHRNYGLDHVTADWVLIMDGDERLSEPQWASLSTLIKQPNVLAHAFQVKNYHSEKDLSSFDMMVSYRLFRNGYGIKYEGSVHNQLAPSIEKACILNHMTTSEAPIVIDHYGYALSEDAMQAKRQRIYGMVKNQLKLTGNDPYYIYHLINICLAMGRFEEARNAVSLLHMPSLRPELRVQAYYKSAQVVLHFDDHKTAAYYLHQAMKIEPEAAFLHYLRSNVFYQMYRFSEGLRYAYRALDLASKETETPPALHVPVDECFSNIGVGYMLSGDHLTALPYFQQALNRNPFNEVAQRYIGTIEKKMAPAETAEAIA